MSLFGNEEHKEIYMLLCLDSMRTAWKEYRRKIEGVQALMREKGFTKSEIKALEELSRKQCQARDTVVKGCVPNFISRNGFQKPKPKNKKGSLHNSPISKADGKDKL